MDIEYTPEALRYDTMMYRRSGNSGLRLPAISLGLWHNFGDVDDFIIYRTLGINTYSSTKEFD